MIAAGIGARRECSSDLVVALVRRACDIAGQPANVLAIPWFKKDDVVFQISATALGIPLQAIPHRDLLAAQDRCVTRSEHTAAVIGLPAVAEAAALAAAGAASKLLVPRISNGHVTCAVAIGE